MTEKNAHFYSIFFAYKYSKFEINFSALLTNLLGISNNMLCSLQCMEYVMVMT